MRFLLQRIDFGCAEEKDAKKAKTTKEAAAQASSKWPWQGLVENLQMAQQELSYILDFITHVRIILSRCFTNLFVFIFVVFQDKTSFPDVISCFGL